MDTVECFHRLASEMTTETLTQDEAEWVRSMQPGIVLVTLINFPPDFRYRSSEKLERFGDGAMDAQQHDEAFKNYSAALSIHPANTQGSTILRCKVSMAKKLWEDALDHANEVRDPFLRGESSISNRNRRQLHSIRRRHGAMRQSVRPYMGQVATMMRSKHLRRCSRRWVNPLILRFVVSSLRNFMTQTVTR